jgi:hypothetical protein
MAPRLDVAKIAYGAFAFPWWHRRAFISSLTIPTALIAAFTLAWQYWAHLLPTAVGWGLYAAYGALFSWFAVTCHRLVLIDHNLIAIKPLPNWSKRETQLFFWMVILWLICLCSVFIITTLILNIWLPLVGGPNSDWFEWTIFVAKLPVFYLFVRLCLIFPAIAVDKKVDLKWAWKTTEGNSIRLIFLVGFLPWFISTMIGLMYREEATIVEIVILTFLSCMLFTVEVAALSLSYKEITKEENQHA